MLKSDDEPNKNKNTNRCDAQWPAARLEFGRNIGLVLTFDFCPADSKKCFLLAPTEQVHIQTHLFLTLQAMQILKKTDEVLEDFYYWHLVTPDRSGASPPPPSTTATTRVSIYDLAAFTTAGKKESYSRAHDQVGIRTKMSTMYLVLYTQLLNKDFLGDIYYENGIFTDAVVRGSFLRESKQHFF